MKIRSYFSVVLLGVAMLVSRAAMAEDSAAPGAGFQPADVIIYNAKVLAVNSNFTIAQAVAIRDGRILAVGKDKLLETYRGPKTRLLDAQGKTVMPGLFDASVNSYQAAVSELKGPLPAIDSIAAAQEYIRQAATNKPTNGWIVLDQVYPTRLKEGRMPVKADLDAATTNYAVYWNFGPMAVVNSKALAVSKITKETQNPPGGVIEKDPKHFNPTGLLRNASSVLKLPKAGAPITKQQERNALKRLYALYNEQGITSIGEAQAGPDEIDLFRDMSRSNELSVRITAARLFRPGKDLDDAVDRLDALTNANAGKQPYGPTGAGDDWVRIGALKTEIDGDLGIGSAYLRTPYGMGPIFNITELAYRGEEKQDSFLLGQFYVEAAQRGWQLAGHAAGDAALDYLLNGYEKVQFKQDIRERRFLVLDSAFAAAQDWHRISALGVGVVLEPANLYGDGSNVWKTLGSERMAGYIPFKGWFDRSITAGGASGHTTGTNSLTAANPWNPWLGIWVALTRETKQGSPILPEEQLNREQAIRLYTINNAWLNFQEKQKGSLEPGKLADLIVLNTDIMKCPVDEVRNTGVLLTMVNGKVVWEARLPVLEGPETVLPAVTMNITNGPTDGAVYPVVDLPQKSSTSATVLTNAAAVATNSAAGTSAVTGTNSAMIETSAMSPQVATNTVAGMIATTSTGPVGVGDSTNNAIESVAPSASIAPGTNSAAATNAATVITVSNQTASITVTIQPNAGLSTNQSTSVTPTSAPTSAVSTNVTSPSAAAPSVPTASANPMDSSASASVAAQKSVEPAPPMASPNEVVSSATVSTPEATPATTSPVTPTAANTATNQVTDPSDWSRLISQDAK